MNPVDLPRARAVMASEPGPVIRRRLVVTAAIVVLLVFSVYWGTALNLVDTWQRSDTYSHCIAVFPISVWLLWRMRDRLATLTFRPFLQFVPLLALLSLIWLVGYAANINSLQDFALVASIPVAIVTVLGKEFGRAAIFPLCFMLFAWPFGEIFIPHMINATADFTVMALRASSVPVYRDGNSFVIPSGSWSVVEECSGIRYLLVSFFAGTLFSYLSFRSWRRRLGFVALSLIVPVIANWARAYFIVLLGHLSGNEIAVGVDHLIYGWLFFGIVMTGLFFVGTFWMAEPKADSTLPSTESRTTAAPVGRPWGAIALIVAASLIGPAWAWQIERHAPDPLDLRTAQLPERIGEWRKVPVGTAPWTPRFDNPSWKEEARYVNGTRQVIAHVGLYERQREGAKLVNFNSTALADFDMHWRTHRRETMEVAGPDGSWPAVERELSSYDGRRLAWEWNWAGGREVAGLLATRLYFAQLRMTG
ncbi:MAG: exosortase A, partial [Burkholderiales bacterium]|nr:exosortase A [Burkholderiales bacterium]